MVQAYEPQPGDIFLACDDGGYWAVALRFVRFDDDPRYGIFRDDAGETYSIATDQVRPAHAVFANADRAEEPDPVQQAENRRYRQRSRVTAEQRARQKLTDRQRRTIFALGKGLGLDLDDLRAMTPKGSISKLTVREANRVIASLTGNESQTAHQSASKEG